MPIVALTAQYLKGLKPPSTGRIEIWDERTPGLCLRLSSTGKGAWSFRYRPREGAGFQRITLGSLEALGLADARERAAKQRAAVVDGRDPQKERIAKREAARTALTFDALVQRYIDEYAKPRKASWRNDEGYLKRPRAAWGKRPAAEITRRDIIALLDEIKVAAPISANRTQSIIVTLFNWAVDAELVETNPAARMKKRAKETAKERTLSDAEMRVLWTALAGEGAGVKADVADALRLLLLTGQRPGEIAALGRAEIVDLDDPADARIEIPGARMKAGKPHVVPLAPMARDIVVAAIARRRSDGDDQSELEPRDKAVFASRFVARATLARHSLSQGLRRVIASLDASKWESDSAAAETIASLKAAPPTPHDFRRTVGTGLARLGVSREDRKAVLAHVEDDVHGRHYDKYERLKEKRAALAAWEAHVSVIIAERRR